VFDPEPPQPMSLTKRDIARAIHEAEPAISIAEAVSLVDAIFQAIKDRLAAGEKVMITNFGTFHVVERSARQGINPATGGGLTIDGHQAVAFRPAPSLQSSLDRGPNGLKDGVGRDAANRDLDPAWGR
jgi:DNA-binding protein HU-beta